MEFVSASLLPLLVFILDEEDFVQCDNMALMI